jgi:mannose-6-phosphate isomerase-like protein (cupin superfamily)
MAGFVVGIGEGRQLECFGCRFEVKVSAAQTGGEFSVVEMAAPPGFRAPPALHRHPDMDWHAYVLEGAVAMDLDDRAVTVERGAVVVIPRGTAFRWSNASSTEPVRWLLTYTPGGFENYFFELGEALAALKRPPVQEDLATIVPPLWKKHGVEIVSR